MPDPFIARVLVAMAVSDTGQQGVADHCKVTQGHLSKVLAEKARMTGRMERKLTLWLETLGSGPKSPGDDLETIVRRLAGADSTKQKHIMNILRELSGLA